MQVSDNNNLLLSEHAPFKIILSWNKKIFRELIHKYN